MCQITRVRKKRQQIGIKQAIVVSAPFLLAADSILYFKLYNDLEQDSKQYETLSKLGLTLKEMKQIAAKQVAIHFFIPFAVAAVHAGFAFKMLQNMVSGSVVKTNVLVIIFFCCSTWRLFLDSFALHKKSGASNVKSNAAFSRCSNRKKAAKYIFFHLYTVPN
ncbi:FtsX-like permease family protein [Parageobacillus thermoglucosidasius]|nr:FtsX-like permease family protein [Parageobacillus thermoglucosidasius]